MQVPQWAGPIPMDRRGGPGPRATSGEAKAVISSGIPVLNWQVELF